MSERLIRLAMYLLINAVADELIDIAFNEKAILGEGWCEEEKKPGLRKVDVGDHKLTRIN